MRNPFFGIGVIVGIVVVVILVRVMMKADKKNDGGTRCVYDERQQAQRGKCYEYAFFAGLGVQAVFVLLPLFGIDLFTSAASSAITVFVGVSVFAVSAICKDAYWGLKEKRKNYIILLIAVIASEGIQVFDAIREHRLIADGKLTVEVLPLMAALSFLSILIALALHAVHNESGEEDE